MSPCCMGGLVVRVIDTIMVRGRAVGANTLIDVGGFILKLPGVARLKTCELEAAAICGRSPRVASSR